MSDTTTTTTRWDELTEAGRQAVARGDLAAATASYRSALAEAEATAPDSARVASSLSSLGQVRYQAKDYADAEPFFQRAVAIRERLLGAEHPTVAQTLNNLAAVHVALGALDEAEPLLLRALAITERHRGRSHPDVAVNLNNLAKLYFKRYEHAKAEPLLARLLELEQAANPTHPKVATALTSLASSRLALRDVAGAESFLRRAEAIVGAQNPGVSAVRAKLEAVRNGTATPSATSRAIDPGMLISGPVAPSDAPTRRLSGPLPMNAWLAESEPPGVLAAESGDYDATQPPAAESTRIVPTGTQEPIAPPLRTTAPAPLPPLVVPAQVPREFGDAMGRAASEGSAVTVPAPPAVASAPTVAPTPIKEAPSARPSAASLDAAVAAIARFAPPPVVPPPPPVMPPQAPHASLAPEVIQASPTASAPAASAPAASAPAASAPAASAPTPSAPTASPAAQLTPPPLIPPPSAPLPRPPAPATTATAFVPPVAYAPPAAPAAAPLLGLDGGFVPMPPAPAPAFAAPAPALPDLRPPRAGDAPRFAPPAAPAPPRATKAPRAPERTDASRAAHAPHAPRAPRLQHESTRSSGGAFRFVLVALAAAALGGGAWLAFARSEGRPSPFGDRGAGRATPATRSAVPGAPSPITGVPSSAPPGAAGQPPMEEITSSPVPISRRERVRPAPAGPPPTSRPTPSVRLPVVNTEQVTRGIDSVAKKVDATLRPSVAPPAFGKPASP